MTRRIELLPSKGEFYKANLHNHTTLSDGKLTPEQVKEAYMQEGYAIVAFTDHRAYKWHQELIDENFVALAGYEVDLNETFKVARDFSRIKTYHINLYDMNPQDRILEKEASPLPTCEYGDVEGLNTYIEKMKALGFLACYNHPYWSLQSYEDYKGLKGLWGMEIYNHGCEHDGLYGYNPQSYDEVLRQGEMLFCVATDDNHNTYPIGHPLCDSFGGFTMIKAEGLTYQSVIEAMVKGHFYSSMGPEIQSLYIEDDKVYIQTSPVEKIFVMTEGRNCYKEVAPQGQTITQAVFTLDGNEGYIRVQCRDGKGLYANSNAYRVPVECD